MNFQKLKFHCTRSTLRLNMTEKLINWSRERKKLMRQRGRKCQIELFKTRVEKQSNI